MVVGPGGRVAPDGPGGGGGDVDDALFGSFAPDEHTFVALVHVGNGDTAEFAGADASIHQHKDDGLVTAGSWATLATFAVTWQDIPLGGIASVKHGLNIISGVRLDGGLSWLGTFDFSDDVMLDQILLGGLGPEG